MDFIQLIFRWIVTDFYYLISYVVYNYERAINSKGTLIRRSLQRTRATVFGWNW